MPVTVQCEWCSQEQAVIPARAKTYRFALMLVAAHGAPRTGRVPTIQLARRPAKDKAVRTLRRNLCLERLEPITTFAARKFCSTECTGRAASALRGEHPLFKGDAARRKDRRGRHGAWARAVINRDQATCQHCGATGVELHAHHLKPFEHYPELRWELSNGMTLCHRCHWAEHAASDYQTGLIRGTSDRVMPRTIPSQAAGESLSKV